MYKYFDLSNLPILSRGRKTLQVSSYDRQYENKDWGNYLYDIAENTSVIFDDPGCGCIKSIWMAVPSPDAIMEFYFGGEDTPRYTSSLSASSTENALSLQASATPLKNAVTGSLQTAAAATASFRSPTRTVLR